MTGEFLQTDDPAVREADNALSSCRLCRHWSQWLPNTGDCMHYAYARRANPDLPPKSARITAHNETCNGWEALQ